jgi:hypothetical protein
MEFISEKLSQNYKWIILLFTIISYYELKFYKNFHCLDENFFIGTKTFSRKDDILFDMNEKFNNILRFGHFYQIFILSIVLRETQNDSIEINSQEIEIMEDLNKLIKFI